MTAAEDESGKSDEKAKTRAWPMIRRFWPWVRPHRKWVVVTFLILLISVPVSLFSPLVVKTVVDDAVEASDTSRIGLWAAVLVGLSITSVLLGLLIGYCTLIFHTRVLREIRVRIYLYMQRLSYRYYSETETGYIMSRQVDDVNNLDGIMADAFARVGVDVVKAIGSVAFLFYVEWRLATAGLVLAAVIFGFAFGISGMHKRRAKRAREAWTDVSKGLHQSVSGHTLVQATASERHEARRFTGVLHESVRAEFGQEIFGLLVNHAFSLIGGVGPMLIILAGVWLMVESDFTVGGLFAFFMYLMQMFGAVGAIAHFNPQLQSSIASLERIYEILDTEPEIESPSDGHRTERLEGEIVFEDVSFAYEKDRVVLHDVSFRVEPRTMVALVGPSGAGKSTLAHMIPRFFDPTEGRVLIDGRDLRELDLGDYRRHVGLVPQQIFLFDRTIAENLSYGRRDVTPEELRRAAEAANALEFIEATPDGFETLVGERGIRLSGGQRQRLAIAREILRNPSILILDEATSSLDSETEALIREAMETLLEGRTSVVIAHRLSTIVRADRIIVLDGGRVVETGTHAELLALDGLYARLYRSQFEDLGVSEREA